MAGKIGYLDRRLAFCGVSGDAFGLARTSSAAGDGTRFSESNLTVDIFPWVVLAATALSGFFALAGSTLQAFRRLQLEEAFRGPGGRERLGKLESRLKALRLTTALCRAVANLVLVVAFVYLFDALDGHWWRAAAATASAAGVIAVFGIAIPQAWASYAGEKVVARTLGLLMALWYAMYPVVAVMKAFDLPVRRLSGVADRDGDNGDSAKQEILQAASEGQAEGAVDADEVQMIESVMELGDTHAAEIMTPRTDIFALSADLPLAEACEKVIAAGHTRVPVYEGDIDNIIGILYAKDMLEHVARSQSPPLRKIMRKPYFVPETKPLDDLLHEFRARKVHLSVALDEYGGTAGIVTIEDVLEEIVGDISDEYDRVEPALLKRIDEVSAEADGRLHVDDLNDAMKLSLPEDEDYETVAGLVFSELGYIPSEGETLEVRDVKFTVLAADERRITRLRVDLPAPAEQ